MKSSILLAICFMIGLITASRITRDVTELNESNNSPIYLPPNIESKSEIEITSNAAKIEAENKDEHHDEIENIATTSAPNELKNTNEKDEETATLGPDGYVYKTVRRLRYRQRRDVSHLSINRDYLPPVAIKPSLDYLPPIETSPKPQKLNNIYLPPVEHIEIPTTEAPTTTTIITTTEAATEAPTTQKEPIEETAILTKDGYHYKKPEVIPDLSLNLDYLPPFTDNRFRYRTIRRSKF